MEEALDELQRRVDSGAFAPIEDDEDEATALERGLLEIAGDELGGKLRAGRSRNDQIACLIRMWLRRHARRVAGLTLDLVNALIAQCEQAGDAVMPGRTHMQHAQPVLLAHQLMAHVWPLLRDVQRTVDWDARIDASPYGSGALAGNTLGLTRRTWPWSSGSPASPTTRSTAPPRVIWSPSSRSWRPCSAWTSRA